MALSVAAPGGATADQASQPSLPAAGHLSVGDFHSCAVIGAAARCWGFGGNGQLGYGNTASIGDNDEPGAFGPVEFGAGRSVRAISSGNAHTCALLDDATVRCWGFGNNGRLGYGNTASIGDNEPLASIGAVDLGAGRTAKAISAGEGHTCAVLDNDTVRCWGFNLDGRLGYGSTDSVGDDETPGQRGPVNLGAGRTAKAISAGGSYTCALLDNDTVRCWGFGGTGRLGYGNTLDIGRTPATTPDTVGPVDLGPGRTARAITTGLGHTCALLDTGAVRCWGYNGNGRLGYGDTVDIGDNESPGSVGPVDLGPGRTATAIDAGREHTCAVLDDGSLRCWGYNGFGQLGLGHVRAIGDNEPVTAADPVDVGPAGATVAVSGGREHTCALLVDASVRCWGYGVGGRLGYCNEVSIGDTETPASAGPVALGQPGIAGATCGGSPPPPPPTPPPPPEVPAPPAPPPPPAGPSALDKALAAQRTRARALDRCLRNVQTRLVADRRKARSTPAARRSRALRLADLRAKQVALACRRRHGRTPGRVVTLSARAGRSRTLRLAFRAAGTDAAKPPAARTYVVKQSTRPIRTARDFARAASLCKQVCRFDVTEVGARLTLNVTELRPRGLYHYAIAARDNVSARLGPRSKSISARAG